MTTRQPGDDDRFSTAALRETVLRTWAASPARFREDANAEEHLALGYRSRVLAELAANGADAAAAAGEPGELVISLRDAELRVANSGAPLTADGVAALAALRASAKRDSAAIGHFGVGFTAVRSLSDEPEVASVSGGVRFSATRTAAEIAALGVPGLDAEMRRRGGQVPALRLPWPTAPATDLPSNCVTEVRLPLRADLDPATVSAQLTVDTAMDLLWALPDLAAVTIDGQRVSRVTDPADPGLARILVTPTTSGPAGAADADLPGGDLSGRRFRTRTATGRLPPELLADRPVEERTRDRWRLTWVLPVDEHGHPDPLARSMIGAPTATDEPLRFPARLVGTLPVDESRSRLAAGAATDHLLAMAADVYVALVQDVDPGDRPALIPPAGLPVGEVDAALGAAVTDRLQHTAFLAGAGGAPVTPGSAVLVAGVSGTAAAHIAEAMPGLLDWPASPERVQRLRSIGVAVAPLSSVTAALAQLDRPAEFWRPIYDALHAVPADELADLPVPRRGGGTIVGPRGLLLADGDGSVTAPDCSPRLTPPPGDSVATGSSARSSLSAGLADRAARLLPGLRLAAAGADHPLLRRLGAIPASATAIAEDPAMDSEIARRLDDLDHFDPDPADLREFAELLLDLLDAGGTTDRVPLADVLLTDADGEPWPAGRLLLPDAPLAALLAADADLPMVGAPWIVRYGPERLAALGVRSGFTVRRYPAPPGPDTDLPDVAEWAEQAPATPGETFTAVPDLDLIAEDAWPAALALLTGDRDTRDALRPTATGPSYTAWWLRRHARIHGVPLGRWRTPQATELAGLYDELPVTMPASVAADLGVLASLADAAADPAGLLGRWADPGRYVPPYRVPALTVALVAALGPSAGSEETALPPGVRTLAGEVIGADRAAVLDLPWLAQVLDPGLLVAGGPDPALVADALDLPLASEGSTPAPVVSAAAEETLLSAQSGALRCLRACGREDLAQRPVTVDAELVVRVDPGGRRRVSWWCDGDRLLLDGTAESIARAVAHLVGQWPQRYRLTALARGDDVALAEAGLD